MKSRYLRTFLTSIAALALAVNACATFSSVEAPTATSRLQEAATSTPEQEQPQPSDTPASEPPPSAAPASGPQWTVLMYMDADDNVLEGDIFIDLNELERVGSTDQVQIIAQIDRHNGAFAGDGDWISTKRFYVTQDDDLETVSSQEIEDMGEADMGESDTLADFITWGIQNYPAQKYALILSDHGGGWTGGWTDPDPQEDSKLYIIEIQEALAQGLANAGVEKFELFGFDACLMSEFEVFAALYPYANFAVASEEVIPAIGWAYTAWAGSLVADPTMDGRALSQAILDSYIFDDSRIQDDQQRAALFGPGSAEQIAQEVASEVTLSAIDLSAFPGLISAVDSLAAALVNADPQLIAKARTYAQSFETLWGTDQPSPFIDLGHFAALMTDFTDAPEVSAAAEQVKSAIQQALVAEKHGDQRPGSTGFSIFFPTSQIYQETLEDYTYTTATFPEVSSWDDFLSHHYYGTPFEPVPGQVQPPPSDAPITAPGAGEIQLLPVEISTDTINPGGSVFLTSAVSGDNIAYVYTFVGYYDEASQAVLVADMDFVYTEGTFELDGVFYPDFSGGTLDLEWEWTANLFNLNDGAQSAFALFEPHDYGAPDASSIYSVYGIWHYADGSPSDYASVYFADGEMIDAYAYAGEDGNGAPRQITPTYGDQFTILMTIYTQDENGQVQTYYEEGQTFTFGEAWFTWEQVLAPAGVYYVGFIAMDFDGNYYYQLAPVVVQE